MRLIIFSDVHGNLPALKEMLNHAGDSDGYICLGDTVGYGPWANECVDMVLELKNCIYLRGNHEDYHIKGEYAGFSDSIAKLFFKHTYPSFERIEEIKNLPEEYKLNGFTFRHTILNKNIYPDTHLELSDNYVIGHSHHQFMTKSPPFVLYNTGSVGQNRGYINVINYLVLETETMKVEMKELLYNVDEIINEMSARDYPNECIEYYVNKKRLASGQ